MPCLMQQGQQLILFGWRCYGIAYLFDIYGFLGFYRVLDYGQWNTTQPTSCQEWHDAFERYVFTREHFDAYQYE